MTPANEMEVTPYVGELFVRFVIPSVAVERINTAIISINARYRSDRYRLYTLGP